MMSPAVVGTDQGEQSWSADAHQLTDDSGACLTPPVCSGGALTLTSHR